MTEESRIAVLERGTTSFMGVDLVVTPGVLIPRPETELLGRTALTSLANVQQPRIIDMCAGSGNLACALAVHRPDAQVWAADASGECVALIRANCERLALGDRVTAWQSDLFAELTSLISAGSIDLVVCNPPYISSHRLDTQSNWLLDQEPRLAFDGGPYGINILRRVVREALGFLRDGGTFCCEFGEGQHVMVGRLLTAAAGYEDIEFVDNESVPRVVKARKKASAGSHDHTELNGAGFVAQ